MEKRYCGLHSFAGTEADSARCSECRKLNQPSKQRTAQQNRALHLMFTQLADTLNEHGLDMRKTLRPEISIPWTSTGIKEYIWRPVQRSMLDKESTTLLTTKEIDEVFETIARHFSTKFGLVIDFPSVESILNRRRMEHPDQ